MDPDEPLSSWFDAVFHQLGEDRSATLRRRLAITRVRVASLIAAEHPNADLTPDLFVGSVPMLVLEIHLPASIAAARSHLSSVSRLVAAARAEVSDQRIAGAEQQVRAARALLDERARHRPPDPWATRVPLRLPFN